MRAQSRDYIRKTERLNGQEYKRRLRAISDAAVAITSVLALDKVLQRIVDAARELSNARYAALGLVEEGKAGLSGFLVSGLTQTEIEAIGPWPQGAGLLGMLLRDPRPVRARNIANHPASAGFPPNHPPMTNFLGVPIVCRGRILGSFYLTNKIGWDEFTEEDEDLLVLFASHAAVAIENARLFAEISPNIQEKASNAEYLAGMMPQREEHFSPVCDEGPVEEYIHTISHDLRNPLTVIIAQAQSLIRTMDKGGLKDRVRHSAEAIETAAGRMNKQIQDMVDSAQLASTHLALDKKPVYADSFVPALLDRLAPVIGEGSVRVEVPAGLPPLNADQDRLERILVNLLSNALRHSPPEAEVTIRAEKREGEAVISVSDHGAGLDPKDLPFIFDRFRQGPVSDKFGPGLGLHICRVLVEAHGGRIWAESEPGKGSTFYFAIPLVSWQL